MSAVWVIRAGRKGKDQRYALDNGCAVIGWNHLGSVHDYESVEEVKVGIQKQEPDNSEQSAAINAWQVWRFANTDNNRDSVKKGDWVVLPLMSERGKRNGYSAVGKVAKDYRYDGSAPDGCRHQRPVDWQDKEFSDGDIPHQMGIPRTVFQIGDEEMGEHLARALKGQGGAVSGSGVSSDSGDIKVFIMNHFTGRDKAHKMEKLVAEILTAMGYDCELTPTTGDGGIDILVSRGLADIIVAQVKSGDAGSNHIRELVGVAKGLKGLLVAWRGFGSPETEKKYKIEFPSIRLWNAEDVLRLADEYYDRFQWKFLKKEEFPLTRVVDLDVWEVAGSVQ